METAEMDIIKLVQSRYFGKKIFLLIKQKSFKLNNKLLSLNHMLKQKVY